MPDIKPGRKSLPLVSDLVSAVRGVKERAPLGAAAQLPPALLAWGGGVPGCFGVPLALDLAVWSCEDGTAGLSAPKSASV